VAIGIAVLDHNVATLDEPRLFETLKYRRRQMRVIARPADAEEPDYPQWRTLRPRPERPCNRRCGRRAGEERDELAPSLLEHGDFLP
jgi:hypothetical protein